MTFSTISMKLIASNVVQDTIVDQSFCYV